MEKERLKSLRRKQYLNFNLCLIILLSIYFALLFRGIELRIILIFLGTFIILTLPLMKWIREISFKIFPYKKELYYYEKERLKGEWDKTNRINNISMLIVAIMIIFQGLNHDSTINREVLKIMIFMMPLFIALLNLSLLFHNRKIDNDNSLEGFTQEKLIFSIVLGVIFIAIIMGITMFLII